MKKENLIAQLEAAKALTSVVSIDNVIALIRELEQEQKSVKVFGISEELASTIGDKIQRALDYNSDELVDKDSACFEISYDNRVELSEVNVDIYEIMRHVEAAIAEFVLEGYEEEADDEDHPTADWDGSMEGTLRDVEYEDEHGGMRNCGDTEE
jgi:hypothetical protein